MCLTPFASSRWSACPVSCIKHTQGHTQGHINDTDRNTHQDTRDPLEQRGKYKDTYDTAQEHTCKDTYKDAHTTGEEHTCKDRYKETHRTGEERMAAITFLSSAAAVA